MTQRRDHCLSNQIAFSLTPCAILIWIALTSCTFCASSQACINASGILGFKSNDIAVQLTNRLSDLFIACRALVLSFASFLTGGTLDPSSHAARSMGSNGSGANLTFFCFIAGRALISLYFTLRAGGRSNICLPNREIMLASSRDHIVRELIYCVVVIFPARILAEINLAVFAPVNDIANTVFSASDRLYSSNDLTASMVASASTASGANAILICVIIGINRSSLGSGGSTASLRAADHKDTFLRTGSLIARSVTQILGELVILSLSNRNLSNRGRFQRSTGGTGASGLKNLITSFTLPICFIASSDTGCCLCRNSGCIILIMRRTTCSIRSHRQHQDCQGQCQEQI